MRSLLAGLVLLCACQAKPKIGTLLVPPDAARTQAGGDGVHGAALTSYDAQARLSEAMRVNITYPANADALPVSLAMPPPIVVLVQGGLVSVARYQWLATHLATRGYTVIAPNHLLDLALLEIDNARIALDDALALDVPWLQPALSSEAPVAVGGHSLGGVVSAHEWDSDSRFSALFLLASFAAKDEPVEQSTGKPVVSLVGSTDQKALPDDVFSGFQRFGQPRLFGLIEGMNHYAWTDDASSNELKSDGVNTRPVPELRRDALRVLDAWLDAKLKGEPQALTVANFPGVSVRP